MIANLRYPAATPEGMNALVAALGMKDSDLGEALGRSYQTIYRWRRHGASRTAQLALIGLLVERGEVALLRRHFPGVIEGLSQPGLF